MRRLTLLSGPAWPLGTRVRRWLRAQHQHVAVEVVALGSAAAERRFAGLVPAGQDDLIAVSDEGDVWRGDSAWLLLLWALRRWRPSSLRLAAPARRADARRLVLEAAGALTEGRSGTGSVPGAPLGGALGALAAPAEILAALAWVAAAALAGSAGVLVLIFAACLFWAGGGRGFLAASAFLVLAAAGIFGLAPGEGGPGGSALVLLLFFGIPALLVVARAFRSVEAAPRRHARRPRLAERAPANAPTSSCAASPSPRPPGRTEPLW